MANPVCINCLKKLKECTCQEEEDKREALRELNEADYDSWQEDYMWRDDRGKAFIYDPTWIL